MNTLELLRQYWGYKDFRGIQREIIDSIMGGHDTLGLMPTGGGKSLTFQVPALAYEGVCLVITPLIALMKDQVMHLRERGIQASAIFSGMSRQEIVTTLDNCIFGGVKILYVSPERLSSEIFLTKLKHMKVSFIAVDEAHCISQWGYDFRPSYLNISAIRKLKPEAPILALTATATPEVVEDIQDKLEFKEHRVFSMSFERKNLAYIVRRTDDKYQELIHILTAVKGSAIVYVRSRKRSREIAQVLSAENISATYFNAGLDIAVKDQRQTSWQLDKIRVMVATNAFGMGIDKPDVRLVIHIDCPDSIEAYFQEAGRAGRDGQKAYAVLLYSDSDQRKLRKRVNDNFPDKEYIADVYEHLAFFYQVGVGSGYGHTFEFDIDKFCHTYHYFPIQVDAALKILQRAGFIVYETDPDATARVMFLLGRNELYRLKETSPHEEAVITALLRSYGGLFTDYCYIDEAFIAQQAKLTKQQVYLILKGLSLRHIIHFIPQRKMPFVSYATSREDASALKIPREVYEDRKEQFQKRIDAMLSYATNDHECRSRQLLRYFGEKRVKDCGQCDVCLQDHSKKNAEAQTQAEEQIKALLADGEHHPVTDLLKLGLPTGALDKALKNLVEECVVVMEDNLIYLY